MDSNFTGKPDKKGSGQGAQDQQFVLVLHNDDVNTFEFVMKSLEDVCDHTSTQAEQCAMITHYNGRCEILNGGYSELHIKKQELLDRGLSVTIE